MIKIKGLFFRELYLSRKNYLLITAIWFMIVALGILIRLSMLYGNMRNIPVEDLANSEMVLFYIFSYAPAIIIFSAVSFNFDGIISDYSSKWTTFSYSTPVSEYRYVGVKYSIRCIFTVSAFAFSICCAEVMCILYGKKLTGTMVDVLLIILLFSAIFGVVGEQLAYRFKDKNKVQTRLMLCGFVLAVPIIIVLINALKKYTDVDLTNDGVGLIELIEALKKIEFSVGFISIICPILIIGVLVAGYFLSVKAMARREK